ncbi:MAG: glycosyltransferase [Candidatus Woesearchaeota archaeon]
MIIFEMSWEVCNKIGGIYTVLSSKNKLMQEKYGENYYTIGPYENEKEFIQEEIPEFLKKIFFELREIGLNCHYGRWNIDGKPKTILIEFNSFCNNNNEIKTKLWDKYKIDSLNTNYHDFDRPVIWSYACGILIEKIKNNTEEDIIAHAHEWMCGASLLYLNMNNIKVAKVFTTHATILGRTLIGNNQDLYNIQNKIKPEEYAKKYNILAKFHMEKQSAINADIFTTVSEITAIEAEYFLNKKPDVITYNGLDFKIIPSIKEIEQLKKKNRAIILQFIKALFPNTNTNKTIILAIYGRYEIRSKGIDCVARSINYINKKIANKEINNDKNIVCFFFIPGQTYGIKHEIHESILQLNKLKQEFEADKENIFLELLNKQTINKDIKLEKKENILSTHYMNDNDEIINILINEELNIQNNNDNNAKVILYPIYLNGEDELLSLKYLESIAGIDLGLFPSLYEPWGYTPLETAAMSVPAITSNCAGFGKFIESQNTDGVWIIDRTKDLELSSKKLAEKIIKFMDMNEQEKNELKNKARNTAELADWNTFILNYYKAHELALKK